MDRREVATKLDELGLWRGLTDSESEANIAAVEDGVHPWATTLAPTVQFLVDGEELAEGGVEAFINSLHEPLLRLGVDARVATMLAPASGEYVVEVDGEVLHLYDETSWNSEVESEQPWYASTIKPLATLNRSLSSAGAVVRFFVLYPGGNDSVVLLIDPRVVELLKENGLISGSEIPVEA